MTRIHYAVAAVAALSMSASSFAADSGFFGSISAGRASVDTGFSTSADFSVDDTDTAYGITAGYRLNQYFAVEAGYQNLGESSVSKAGAGGSGNGYGDTIQLQNNSRIQNETDGFNLGVIGTYPVNTSFDVFAKLGVFAWDTEYTYNGNVTINGTAYNGSGTVSDDGHDVYFGVGGMYNINDRFGVGVEWVRYDAAETDIDVIGANFVVNF